MSAADDAPDPGGDANGKRSILKSLLTDSDASVKLITLGLVVLTGGTNFWATKEASRISNEEAQRAVNEIHEIHGELNGTINRQKGIDEKLDRLVSRLGL